MSVSLVLPIPSFAARDASLFLHYRRAMRFRFMQLVYHCERGNSYTITLPEDR